ncbi:MAG: IS5 family transposase [Deltaproteobacteria bacterium]
MFIENSTYLLFINIAMEIVSLIKPYSSRYSKKTFTQQQLFILLILRQKLKLSYRELIEDMKTRTEVLVLLGLNRLPRPTTLSKFAKRIKTSLIENLIGSCIKLTRRKKTDLGIDATGYHIEDGSYHYRERLGKASKTRKNLKLSIAVDTNKQLILASKVRKSKAHDNQDFISLVKKSNRVKQVRRIVADKAYDAEKNHEFVVDEIGAECIIPPRNEEVPIHRTKGEYRKKMKRGYSKRKYHQRSKVETVNFVMKRLFGAVIYAKNWIMQKKELLFKCLAYNIHRLVKMRISS